MTNSKAKIASFMRKRIRKMVGGVHPIVDGKCDKLRDGLKRRPLSVAFIYEQFQLQLLQSGAALRGQSSKLYVYLYLYLYLVLPWVRQLFRLLLLTPQRSPQMSGPLPRGRKPEITQACASWTEGKETERRNRDWVGKRSVVRWTHENFFQEHSISVANIFISFHFPQIEFWVVSC